jgi:hypothetical protein
MTKLRQKRLRDRLFHSYLRWREACHEVSDAYSSWAIEGGPDAAATFESYMTALDCEENAADVYAGLLRRAARLRSNTDDPAERLGAAAREVGRR